MGALSTPLEEVLEMKCGTFANLATHSLVKNLVPVLATRNGPSKHRIVNVRIEVAI